MRRTLPRVMVPLATVLLALPFQVSPASADTFHNAPMGGGYGAVFTPGSDDVTACDTASDDLGIRTIYTVNGVNSSVRDLNGSEPGCPIVQNVGTVSRFRVCNTENGVNISCSIWIEDPI
jgi:hypothetical protein